MNDKGFEKLKINFLKYEILIFIRVLMLFEKNANCVVSIISKRNNF